MRCAKNREGVVNMQLGDAEKLDLVISQYVFILILLQFINTPKHWQVYYTF
jgi:hypothetical protein